MLKSEILKYLGHKDANSVDEYTNSLIDRALLEVEQQSKFKYIYEKFDEPLPFMKDVSGYQNYLGDSSFLLCATTLGVQIDRYLQRLELKDMAYATVFDATASVFLEAKADEFEKNLEFGNLGFRFCPGYSGTSFIDNQEIAKILNAEKIGITFLESGMMIPLKSMVGIIKIGENARKSCDGCAAKCDCGFRKNGTYCYKND
ncbi:MAG: hypothetical protein MJZ78_07585 [Bacteroidales bacterium]|nr:hypothetical protein [Bacteroidales bacterium]